MEVPDACEDTHVPEDVTHNPRQVTVMVAGQALTSPGRALRSSLLP